MRWSSHLYIGRKTEAAGEDLLEKIKKSAFLPNIYVITAPKTGNHLFEISPVMLLSDSERKELLVYGVASGYQEAAQTVRRMVEDMVLATGGYDWDAYLEQLGE